MQAAYMALTQLDIDLGTWRDALIKGQTTFPLAEQPWPVIIKPSSNDTPYTAAWGIACPIIQVGAGEGI